MKRRLLSIVVHIILIPAFIVAILLACFSIVFVAPVVWVMTGDTEKTEIAAFGGVQGWIVSLPKRLLGEYD